MRVTDRGPFVAGRVLDLSIGAAKAVGLWRPGTGEVRIDRLQHAEADGCGRAVVRADWCVSARGLRRCGCSLSYNGNTRTANVIEFQGAELGIGCGFDQNDDRALAMTIAHSLRNRRRARPGWCGWTDGTAIKVRLAHRPVQAQRPVS